MFSENLQELEAVAEANGGVAVGGGIGVRRRGRAAAAVGEEQLRRAIRRRWLRRELQRAVLLQLAYAQQVAQDASRRSELATSNELRLESSPTQD